MTWVSLFSSSVFVCRAIKKVRATFLNCQFYKWFVLMSECFTAQTCRDWHTILTTCFVVLFSLAPMDTIYLCSLVSSTSLGFLVIRVLVMLLILWCVVHEKLLWNKISVSATTAIYHSEFVIAMNWNKLVWKMHWTIVLQLQLISHYLTISKLNCISFLQNEFLHI